MLALTTKGVPSPQFGRNPPPPKRSNTALNQLNVAPYHNTTCINRPKSKYLTNTDPAFLRILAKSERYNVRYDAAKQSVPRVEVV